MLGGRGNNVWSCCARTHKTGLRRAGEKIGDHGGIHIYTGYNTTNWVGFRRGLAPLNRGRGTE